MNPATAPDSQESRLRECRGCYFGNRQNRSRLCLPESLAGLLWSYRAEEAAAFLPAC